MLNESDCKRLIKRTKSPERKAKYEARLLSFKKEDIASTLPLDDHLKNV